MDENVQIVFVSRRPWMKSARDQFGVAKLDLSAEFAVFGQIGPIFDSDNPLDDP